MIRRSRDSGTESVRSISVSKPCREVAARHRGCGPTEARQLKMRPPPCRRSGIMADRRGSLRQLTAAVARGSELDLAGSANHCAVTVSSFAGTFDGRCDRHLNSKWNLSAGQRGGEGARSSSNQPPAVQRHLHVDAKDASLTPSAYLVWPTSSLSCEGTGPAPFAHRPPYR